nr:MAG TPA: hypothetical protein [Caudoviricetes sp.]
MYVFRIQNYTQFLYMMTSLFFLLLKEYYHLQI